jgi:hypothetical protein
MYHNYVLWVMAGIIWMATTVSFHPVMWILWYFVVYVHNQKTGLMSSNCERLAQLLNQSKLSIPKCNNTSPSLLIRTVIRK